MMYCYVIYRCAMYYYLMYFDVLLCGVFVVYCIVL